MPCPNSSYNGVCKADFDDDLHLVSTINGLFSLISYHTSLGSQIKSSLSPLEVYGLSHHYSSQFPTP